MIINKSKVKISITDLLLTVVSAIMLIGSYTWFAVCEVKGDTIMSCHWAGEMIKVMFLLMLVLSVIHLFIPEMHFKCGVSLSLLGISAVTLFIPGGIIDLCKMEEMTCRSNTRMWTLIFCCIIGILAIVDILIYLAIASAEKHRRVSR